MADIKFVFRCTERVRPSSPTPQSLRTYKLSLLDQLINSHYATLVLFYNSTVDHDQLKGSLSRALSYLYPLAGRLKDGKTVDCNDEGVDFVRAEVENKMSEVMQCPTLDRLRMLLPCNPYPEVVDSTLPIVAVQVTRFAGGGSAVAFCSWHGLIDGAGFYAFLGTWTAINRGQERNFIRENGSGLVVDSSTTFVPTDLLCRLTALTDRSQIMVAEKYVAKRFVFRGSTINSIRDKYTQSGQRPSRVEALAAFLWAAVIRATRESDRDFKTHTLTMSVDLRKKFNPPFPQYCLGSINQVVGARWECGREAKESSAVDGGVLLGRVREAIKKIDDNYIKKMHVEGGYLNELLAISKTLAVDKNRNKNLNISSWCKIPFYEVDFGWGKPMWIANTLVLKDLAIFVDMDDGGVEVWLGLPQGVMCNLEMDKEFLAHISYNQTVWDYQRNNFSPYNLQSIMKSKM